MVDLVPELLDNIRTDLAEEIARDAKINAIQERIANGTATLVDVHRYSEALGTNLSAILQSYVTIDKLPNGTLYYNIADRIIRPLLEEAYKNVNDTAEQIQAIVDEAADIGLRSIRADFPDGRVHGLIDKAVEAGEDYDKWLGEPIINTVESFSDDYMKANAKFRYESGLDTYIIRNARASCCDWCAALEGKHEYDTDADYYRRHEYCRCDVTFVSDKGRYRQDVWSKKVIDNRAVENRKTYGLD